MKVSKKTKKRIRLAKTRGLLPPELITIIDFLAEQAAVEHHELCIRKAKQKNH